jgi:DNA-binding MarR family transcriptional regulator
VKPLNLPPQALTVPADESGVSLGYLLTHVHARFAQRITQHTQARFGVTGVQAKVLFLLAIGRCDTAADLARECHVDASAITRVLDRVEQRGLLLRVREQDDRRLVRLVPTEAGHTLAAALPEVFDGVLAEAVAGLVPEEVRALRRMLQRILDNGG